MTLDPRIGLFLGIVMLIALYSATGSGADQLHVIFGVAAGDKISGVCAYIGGILGIVVTALHAVPSGPSNAGFFLGPKIEPAAPPAGPGPATKALILFAILVFGAMAFASPSFAQAKKLHVTGKPIEDVKSDIQDATGGIKTTVATGSNAGDVLSQLRAKFTADVTDDLTSALALAKAVPAGCSATPPTQTTGCGQADTTAVPCYQALISLNGVINSYIPPAGKPHVISDLEQLRIVARTVQSTDFKDACAPLVQDIQSQANQLIASVLGIVSGAAKIGIAIP